jgi:aldehyde dehydrogenase (NAD+)
VRRAEHLNVLVVGGAEAPRRCSTAGWSAGERHRLRADGRAVAPRVAAGFGRALLELGGNNAAVVPRRPTSTSPCAASCSPRRHRRAALHDDAPGHRAREPRRRARRRHRRGVRRLPIGDPFATARSSGRSSRARYDAMQRALDEATGRRRHAVVRRRAGRRRAGGYYVRPALVRMPRRPTGRRETFAPLLYVLTYRDFDEAVRCTTRAAGASSRIFTTDQREAEQFLAPTARTAASST